MGGNAFQSVLSSPAFPRLPPAVYHGLKARMQLLLEELYVYVQVPCEAPEKRDHGDVDFVVYLPRRHDFASQNLTNHSAPNGGANKDSTGHMVQLVNVPHGVVSAAIGAQYVNPMSGNRTSNFAIPVSRGEWAQYGLEPEENRVRGEARNEEIFYQVDLNVCGSKDEWERRVMFNSYGDLSMILGLIVKSAGLHLSQNGLKYPDASNPPIILSTSFNDIFSFFGWSMEAWNNGFKTAKACYEWAASSKYFNPSYFQARGTELRGRRDGRMMYAEFFDWVWSFPQRSLESTNDEVPDAREAALDFFNKRKELHERRAEQRRKQLVKASFSGSHVRNWTGLDSRSPGVKKIMDGVREKIGGEANILKLLEEGGAERLKGVVLEVQENLRIFPLPTNKGSEGAEKNADKMDKIQGGG